MGQQKQELKAGTRVRLREPSYNLKLLSQTGTIVRPDKWMDYYIVRLDEPAYYVHADGRQEELTEVREDIDNLDVIPAEKEAIA